MRVVLPATPWTTTDARAWNQRVPRLARLAAAPAALAVGIGFSIARDDARIDAATTLSSANALYSVAQGLVAAALVLCWLVPRGGALTGLVGAVALAAEPAEAAHDTWAVVAAALALVVGADALTLVRQGLVADRWSGGVTLVPAVDPAVAAAARRTAGRRRVALLVLAATAVGGAVLFWHDDQAVRAFRARAQTVDGTIVSVADDETTAEVDLGTTTVRVPVLEAPRVGAAARVTTDGTRAELVDQAFDPTGALLLVTIGAVGAGWVLAAERRRRARVDRLLAGAPALEAVLVGHEEDRLVLAAVDDPRPLVAVQVRAAGVLGASQELEPEPDELDVDLDDEALLAQARRALARAAADAPAPDGPTWPAGSRVTVVGLVDDLSPVAVLGPDGTWVLAPAPVLAAPGHVGPDEDDLDELDELDGLDGSDETDDPDDADDPDDPDEPDGIDDAEPGPRAGHPDAAPADARSTAPARKAPGRLATLAAATGHWGPLVALPLPALVGWVVGEAHSLRAVVLVWGVWALASGWTRLAVPFLALEPEHLVVTGTWRDTLVPWSLLTASRADGDHLMVRWGHAAPDPATGEERDDRAALVFDAPVGTLPALTRDRLDAARTAAAIHAARLAPGPGDARERHRMARPAMAGLAWTVALLGGIVVGW